MNDRKSSKESERMFYDGEILAYYEVLDTIKNELEILEQDLK